MIIRTATNDMLARFFKRRSQTDEQPTVTIDAAAIARRARRLKFLVRPEAASALAGAYLSARPGTGLTFSELRPYEPGDDGRHLDWNATARQGRPYVRKYVEERALALWLIVDVSASLRFGPEGRTKADRAAQAAALLAAAAIRDGDRAGLVLVSDQVETVLPPAGGTKHLARILRALVATPTASRKTDLSAGLVRPIARGGRSLLVVVSDFLSDEAVGPWRSAARRHDAVAIRLFDPREERLPRAGLLALTDLETGRRRLVDSESKRVRAAFETAARERRERFKAWRAATGIASFDVSTEADPLRPLLRFFQGRGARSRGGR
jgi:uncharacterized protein (DUF58 family)